MFGKMMFFSVVTLTVLDGCALRDETLANAEFEGNLDGQSGSISPELKSELDKLFEKNGQGGLLGGGGTLPGGLPGAGGSLPGGLPGTGGSYSGGITFGGGLTGGMCVPTLFPSMILQFALPKDYICIEAVIRKCEKWEVATCTCHGPKYSIDPLFTQKLLETPTTVDLNNFANKLKDLLFDNEGNVWLAIATSDAPVAGSCLKAADHVVYIAFPIPSFKYLPTIKFPSGTL